MNLSITLRDRRTFKEYAGLFMIKTGAWIVVALFLASLGYICYHGAGTLSPSFLSSFPEKMMEEGGILPCIIGTAILSIGAMAVALPLGIVCAVWLNEYAKEGPLKKLITLAVANLAGVPSIVFGLFGLAFFVTVCGLGVSAIAGILTLAVLTLPIVINTVRETLSQIPNSWRESSLALGCSSYSSSGRTSGNFDRRHLGIGQSSRRNERHHVYSSRSIDDQLAEFSVRRGNVVAVSHLCVGHDRHESG